MNDRNKDRIECAIRHIQSSLDVDPWACEIAVEAMKKQLEIVRCKDCKSTEDFKTKYNNLDVEVIDTLKVQPDESKYEYHYDHTDCIWYRPEARNRCPVTCAQYRDGWNDAMNYIFRDGEGYRPYRRDKKYEEGREG